MDISEWLESTSRNLRQAVRALAKSPGIHRDRGADAGARDRRQQRGILGDLRGAAAAAAVSQRRPAGEAGAGAIRRSRSRFVAPVRLEEWNRLNDTFQAITGYYTQDDSETLGRTSREARRRRWSRRAFCKSGASRRMIGPRFRAAGGAVRRTECRADQRPPCGGAASAATRTPRQDAAHRRERRPDRRRHAASFLFPDRDVDLWSPSPPDAPFAQSRELTWFTAIGRLKPGVTLAQARANLATRAGEPGAPVSEDRRGDHARGRAAQGSHRRRREAVALDPVRLGLAAAADRVHQYRGAAAVAGGGPAARDFGALLAGRVAGLGGGATVDRGVGPGAGRRGARAAGRGRRLARISRAGQGPAAHRRDRAGLADRALLAGLRHRGDPALRHLPGDPRDAPESGGLAGARRPLAGVGAQSDPVRAGGRAGRARGHAAGRRGAAAAQLSGTRPRVAGLRSGARADLPHQHSLGGNGRPEGGRSNGWSGFWTRCAASPAWNRGHGSVTSAGRARRIPDRVEDVEGAPKPSRRCWREARR